MELKNFPEFAMSIISESCFGITLNANDIFGWAVSDSFDLDYADFEWALPIIDKYGHDGEIAVMAYVRKIDPIEPRMTSEYKEALREIVKLNPKVESEDSQHHDLQSTLQTERRKLKRALKVLKFYGDKRAYSVVSIDKDSHITNDMGKLARALLKELKE